MIHKKQPKLHTFFCPICERWWKKNLWDEWKYVPEPIILGKIEKCPTCSSPYYDKTLPKDLNRLKNKFSLSEKSDKKTKGGIL